MNSELTLPVSTLPRFPLSKLLLKTKSPRGALPAVSAGACGTRHIYIYIYIYIYVYIYIYIYICIYMYIHKCVNMNIYIYMYIHHGCKYIHL